MKRGMTVKFAVSKMSPEREKPDGAEPVHLEGIEESPLHAACHHNSARALASSWRSCLLERKVGRQTMMETRLCIWQPAAII